jgi:hypothetical protein
VRIPHPLQSLRIQFPSPQALSTAKEKHLFGAFLACLIPGAGQFVLGNRRKATFLVAFLVSLFLALLVFQFSRALAGFGLFVCGWILLSLYSTCDALLAPSLQTATRPSKGWLAVFLPIVGGSALLFAALSLRAVSFRIFEVPSSGIERTVLRGESIVADMRYYDSRRPQRKDLFYSSGTLCFT